MSTLVAPTAITPGSPAGKLTSEKSKFPVAPTRIEPRRWA